MKGYLSISCLAIVPQCDLSGLLYRLNSKQTRVRTISHRALSSKHLFWMHPSTSGRQYSGISTLEVDLDAEDPGVDGGLESGRELVEDASVN